MPHLRQFAPSLSALALIGVQCAVLQVSGLAQSSPFLPPASAAAAAPGGASAGFEFVGMTELGKDTLLSFTRLSDKHSVWVPVGKTTNDITVVSYDPKTDTAVIKANNQTLTLTLRKGAVVAAQANVRRPGPPAPGAGAPPSPADNPALAVPNKPMNAREEKEFEARMLVTDLLEIGQQQRKAYEEAQRQAARQAANPKPPPSPAAEPAKR